MPKHELLVLPAEMGRDGVPRCQGIFGLRSREMLGDVALVSQQDFFLGCAGLLEQAVFEEGSHRLGHAADVVALSQERHEPRRKGADGIGVASVQEPCKAVTADRMEELAKAQGVEVKGVHLADGVSRAFVGDEAKKGSGRCDGDAWRVLAEALEGRECLWALLNLV